MSEPPTFSPALQRFIDEHIHTIDELSTLLFLRSDRQRWWSIDDVVVELRGNRERATTALESLVARKLVSFSFERDSNLEDRTRHYAYAPNPNGLDAMVEELEGSYSRARIEVIMLIASQAVARVRAQALHAFSLTMRAGVRKDEEED
jgi:hypothetical protein